MSNFKAPFKSTAAALLFTLVLGPIGLFYSSIIGGVVMTAFAIAAVGNVVQSHSPLPMATVWLFSLLWSMIAVSRYNKKLLNRVIENELKQHTSD